MSETRKRRAKRLIVIRPVVRLNNEINVTPLVDVVLVLLIIFMVVTPLLEKDIAVQVATPLLEVTEAQRRDQVVVRVQRHGELFVNDEPVASERYAEHLRRLLAGRSPPDRVVFFQASDDAGYSKFVRALDGAKVAGATVLGLTPEWTGGATRP
jgi:biopolymer transport protein ExbD